MKHIIVAGANQGIGYYMVKQLLAQGLQVTALDLETDNLAALFPEPGALLPLICDVSDPEQVNRCVKESVTRFNQVDCAVQNACLCTFGPMESTQNSTYRAVFDVNYFGALNLCRAVLPYMKGQKSGRVIFTSSGVGVTGFDGISPYASTKGALESLAKCLNIEYAGYGISFHIFHPPLTNTKSAGDLPVPKEFMATPEKVGSGLAKNIEKKSFVICHSFSQKAQTALCYLFPIKMGKMMSMMTSRYARQQEK